MIGWFTAILLLSALVALGIAAGPCRPDDVAGFYKGYTCELTEIGLGSIPTNSTALRMLSTEGQLARGGNLTLPHLPVLKILEYDVTRSFDVSERPFVELQGLEHLQLFHSASSADNFRFVLRAGIFEGLSDLKRLILADLGLEDLPIGVLDGLDNLRILELNKNRLSEIPAGTFTACCQSLTVLTLSRNQITDLGFVSRHGLTGLQTLDLSGNRLTSINELDFAGLENVASIELANNEIESIDNEAFGSLSRLTSLHLNGNRLHFSDSGSNHGLRICWGAFCGTSSLQTLDMSNNNISCLPSFQQLRSLTKLDISGNNIDSLSYEHFACLQSLEELDLSENHFTTLDRAFRSSFRRLLSVDVSSNPWNCDCEVYWMAEWLIRSTERSSDIEVINLQRTQCATPVPDRLLTEAYANGSAECDSGLDEDTAQTENTDNISISWVKGKTTSSHEITETVRSEESENTTVTGPSVPDPENIRLPSKEPDTTYNDDHVSTESSKDLIASVTTASPQTSFYTVTEDIRTLDELIVTGISNLDQMKTCDMLLSSVTENMKTLDSLLQKTTANIDTLNKLLITTIDTVESARTSQKNPEANEHLGNSFSETNRPNTALQLLMLLTVGVFVRLFGCK